MIQYKIIFFSFLIISFAERSLYSMENPVNQLGYRNHNISMTSLTSANSTPESQRSDRTIYSHNQSPNSPFGQFKFLETIDSLRIGSDDPVCRKLILDEDIKPLNKKRNFYEEYDKNDVNGSLVSYMMKISESENKKKSKK